jgi:hypothetical protein
VSLREATIMAQAFQTYGQSEDALIAKVHARYFADEIDTEELERRIDWILQGRPSRSVLVL